MIRNDSLLMAAIGQRDAAAFRCLVDRHAVWSLRFVERLVGERAAAEDIVQLSFLRIWEQAEQWQANAKFTTWFYRVLHNLALDHLRAKQGRQYEALDEELPDSRQLQEEALMQAQQGRLVQEALASLPDRQRTAIVLCHYEALSQAEAATALGVSEGALESLLTRGRAALKALVQKHWH